MKQSVFTMRYRAFTMIELMVAIAILGILSSLVIVNISIGKRKSRDTERMADASELLTSVNQYVQANGTSFITYPDASGKPGSCTVASTTDPSQAATSATGSCVGASGRAYGLVNATSMTVAGVGTPTTNRVYPAHSIVQALVTGGYLSGALKDPSNGVGTLTGSNDANNTIPDYALIRACPNGRQHVATRGQLFAVWVMLENKPSTTDVANLSHVVGNVNASPDTGAGYDFAAGSTYQALFQSNGYGVSNGPSQPQSVGMNGECGVPVG